MIVKKNNYKWKKKKQDKLLEKGKTMKNKYYNNAIIGGKNITASYSKTGELLRVMYPNPDFRSWIDEFLTGVKINDSGMIYLHEDCNNQYHQYYTENTNILKTEILNTYFQLQIKQTDFALLKNSILVKKYEFENKNNIDLKVNFLVHSKLLSDTNNMVGSEVKYNTLIQYCHDYCLYLFSPSSLLSYQLNDTKENIGSGEIYDKDYIGMSCDSSISYDIGILKPGEKKELVLYLYFKNNTTADIGTEKISSKQLEEQLLKEIAEIKKIDVQKEEQNVEKYWKKYVKEHLTIPLKPETNTFHKKWNQIYQRSILLFPLLINQETGGISATVEVDENMTQCGRYAYCWPRDAVWITKALDILKMTKETEKFYKIFCKETQSKNGMWEQRFYTDGKLAPCWGYQIDETASVIYGVYEHYKVVKDAKFLKDTYKMCENAAKFLGIYLDNVLGTKDESDVVKKEIEETYHTEGRNKLPVSYDLWEMHEGVHLYSLSAIYAAFEAMKQIHIVLKPGYEQNNRLKVEAMNKLEAKMIKYQEEIKKYILANLYDENTKTFSRNLNDNRTDISELGMIVPFALFSAKEKKVQNTIEKINMTLRTYTGGYLRFEQDHYRGGTSPWPIATLWMAMYYQKAGERKKAKECIEFVVNSANEHGLLGEQVDNQTMQPNWAIGLRMGPCYVCFGDGSH